MQTGDRPDPFRIAGGLLLFVFAVLIPARRRKISENLSPICSKRPAGDTRRAVFTLISALTSAPCAVRR